MIDIVSIDVGNITTIGFSGDKCMVVESRIKEYTNIDELGSNDIMTFDNKKYVIEQGEFENNLVKHEKENFLPLMFYTIAKITEEEHINLVIGIPAGQYNDRKDELKEFIKENNFKRISINDKPRQIYIDNVLVVPESYGLKANGAMAQCESGLSTLVVDIGGGTTDIADFNENYSLIGGESIKYGLLDLYRLARKTLSNKPYDLDITLAEAKKYFDGDKDLLNKDTSYKNEIMLQSIKIIVNELRGLYPNLSNTNIILTGGGAEKIYPTFKKLYPQTIPVTDIKANAKGFYKIGVKRWQKR